jgi:basic membrane protein A
MKKILIISITSLIVAIVATACKPSTNCESEEVFCVGLVTDASEFHEDSINQSAWEGVQQAEKDLGAQVKRIESKGADTHAGNIASLAGENYDVIVTVGFALADATTEAATMYPDIDFIGVDQFQSQPVEGVAGLNFAEDQAGFLAGSLAAIMSKNQKIGAVCASNEVPSIWRFGEGYKAGAAYADQLKGVTTLVMVAYHDGEEMSFTDPEWGQATARTMLDQDVDVIFGCGGATGDSALVTAADAGAYTIGMNIDQYLTLPDAASRMLTSVTKQISSEVFELITLAREGAFPSGNYFGEITYAPYHDLEDEVPVAVKAVLEQIEAGLRDGSIQTNIPLETP